MRKAIAVLWVVAVALPAAGCSSIEGVITSLVASQIGCLVDPTSVSTWAASAMAWVGALFAGL